MSWSRRGVLTGLAAALALVPACGFTPVYAPGGGGAALDGAVQVRQFDSDDGFVLARALRNRLGPPQTARYTLSYSVGITSEQVAITTDQITQRFNLIGRAPYQLTDAATGAVVVQGTAEAFSSYSALGTSVAVEAAERDGRERLMRLLADRIMTDLIAGVTVAAP